MQNKTGVAQVLKTYKCQVDKSELFLISLATVKYQLAYYK